VEVQEAISLGIPVLKRADFLGELTAGKRAIAVAGTAGKTTTAALIAWLLTELDQNPSFILGGVSNNLGVNARAGQGSAFVIEADEYDRMFLGLNPAIEVVTNISHDHPDCFPTPADFYQAFAEFVERLQPEGLLLACGDDPGASRLAQEAAGKNVRTALYGVRESKEANAKYQARNLEPNPAGGFDFDFYSSGKPMAHASLQIPGQHNVLNATAGLGVVDLLGLPVERAAAAINEFNGVGRRFELRGEAGGVVVVDDYAHHPSKIRATLAAARVRFPGRRIWAVWQPHTYSRTQTLFGDFVDSFADADRVIVTEIYAARESLRQDLSAQQLVEAMKSDNVMYAPTFEHAVRALKSGLKPGDVVMVLSAGDADWICTRILADLSGRQSGRQDGQPGGVV
jgi:UDP-N-acetylmuramate--alanine ligase